MKKHEFYAQYANIPLSGKNSRFLKRRYGNWNKSPQELYDDIRGIDYEIDKLQREEETLLEIADKIITPTKCQKN
jgi:hypothetical protein